MGPAIVLLGSLVVLGLFSAIYHRDKNSFTLSYLVMAVISVAVAAVLFLLLFMTSSAMKRNQDPQYMFIGVGFLLAIAFLAYFFASTIYIFMYRPFHYNNLKARNANGDWKGIFSSKNFDEGWGEDRRLLWWTTLFSFVAFLGFLLTAISFWMISRYYVDAAKMAVGLGCFAGVILSCFAILQLNKAQKYHNNFTFYNQTSQYFSILFVLLVIVIIILTANAVLNLFKKKSAYFICGLILLFWLFIFASFLGLLLRDLREKQFDQINHLEKCADVLDSLH